MESDMTPIPYNQWEIMVGYYSLISMIRESRWEMHDFNGTNCS